MNKKFFISKNKEQTMNLAKDLALQLKGGETICLNGDLGAGKTVFVKGLAKGLGIKELITSPTFVLVKEFNTNNLKLYHIDCYRLESSQDLLSLGFQEWLKNGNIIVIEWADNVRDILPKNCINIKFEIINETRRKISYY